jgi:hypothetical protein
MTSEDRSLGIAVAQLIVAVVLLVLMVIQWLR